MLKVILLAILALLPLGQTIQRSEIFDALKYGVGVFEPDQWLVTAGEYDDRTTAQWNSVDLGALVYLELLPVEDYSASDLAGLLNRQWFEAVLANYQSWGQTAGCTSPDGTLLYEFNVVQTSGAKDLMRYWAAVVSPSRMVTISMEFPGADSETLDRYAARLFPHLVTCAEPDRQVADTAEVPPPSEALAALEYGAGVFEPDLWHASVVENDQRTNVTWETSSPWADNLYALAYMDYLHFGDVTPDSMAAFFDQTWFDGTLSNYASWTQTASCGSGDLLLWQFDVTTGAGDKYLMRYWAQYVSDTRVAAMFITFPRTRESALDRYAERAFPDLPRCGN